MPTGMAIPDDSQWDVDSLRGLCSEVTQKVAAESMAAE